MLKATFYYFMKTISLCWAGRQQHFLKKVGTGPCRAFCSILSSFATICKCLRTEETSCWTFGRRMLLHSCLINDPSCSVVLGVCRIMLFMMCQMFSTGERREVHSCQLYSRRQFYIVTNSPPYHQRCSWTEHWQQTRWSLSSLVCRREHPWFSKRISICQFINPTFLQIAETVPIFPSERLCLSGVLYLHLFFNIF